MLNSLSPFTLNDTVTVEDLSTALQGDKFIPCANSAQSSTGFTSPLNNSELVHESNNCLLFALKIESKVIPASTLKKEVAERVAKIEETEQRNLSKKEKDQVKDVHCDSKEQRLDADFYLMSETVRELLAFLVKFTNKENLAA